MEDFVDIIQHICQSEMDRQNPTDLVSGVVTGISPLKVKVDGRFEVGASHLILSALCKERTVTPECTHSDCQLRPIVVWRGLGVGDRVRMLRCGHGQTFYILDREEGATA